MRSHLTLFAASFAGVLAVVLLLAGIYSQAAYAQADCAKTYRVKRGDWLADIARRKHISTAKLIRLNPWLQGNPNRIYSGQVLCLEAAAAGSQEVPAPSQVAIEVTYTYTPTEDEEGVTTQTVDEDGVIFARGLRIGKRVLYPMEPSEDAFTTFGTTEEIVPSITTTPAPVLLGVRNAEDDTTYTLIAMGTTPEILTPLLISDTEKVKLIGNCTATPVLEALGGPNVNNVEITFWLEAANGLGYPFKVAKLDLVEDGNVAEGCYGSETIAFVLLPAPSGQAGQYRVVMLMTEQVFGPPGRPKAERCRIWSRSRGYFYRWLRSWYGCP